jgi:hypothetical protein
MPKTIEAAAELLFSAIRRYASIVKRLRVAAVLPSVLFSKLRTLGSPVE